jgi:hypothetical protein
MPAIMMADAAIIQNNLFFKATPSHPASHFLFPTSQFGQLTVYFLCFPGHFSGGKAISHPPPAPFTHPPRQLPVACQNSNGPGQSPFIPGIHQ